MSPPRLMSLAIPELLAASAASAQSLPDAPGAPAAAPPATIRPASQQPPALRPPDEADAAPAEANRPAPPVLADYLSCSFADGLQIARIDALPAGPQERIIHTLDGERTIHMLDGRRIMFAYGVGGDYFANVKPELLPAASWSAQKDSLLDELQALERADFTMLPNTTLPRELHGLEVHGFDRNRLEGGTLGLYLLFDDRRHVATSIYFVNQNPLARRFQTIEQYRELRTRFLERYTECVQQNLELRDPSAARAPAATEHP